VRYGRSDLAAAAVNGIIYAVGGINSDGAPVATVEATFQTRRNGTS
jgi:hypothetical protein